MHHTLHFFPLGNADCCRIDLANGQKLLFDYADRRDPSDPEDLRVDLPTTLRSDLRASGRPGYDVVAFTHLDDDHICGASEFFHLDHDPKYQGSGRATIGELWVPAAVITEEGCSGDAAILQKEARWRLVQQGRGIRVFSRPAALAAWLARKGLSLASRAHLITDAGKLVPGFVRGVQGAEFFVHSPFASRTENGGLEDRNADSLVLHVTFESGGRDTKLLLMADITYEVLAEIVDITRARGNDERLEWDIVKLPHHCSYLSLGPEKGKEKTEPVPSVAVFYEEKGRLGGDVVSTSWPIPAADEDQPPHRQAARYYQDVTAALGGELIVTMEHPTPSAPQPLVIRIDAAKATVVRTATGGAASLTSRPAPRAG
jgi:hypothetical protein